MNILKIPICMDFRIFLHHNKIFNFILQKLLDEALYKNISWYVLSINTVTGINWQLVC